MSDESSSKFKKCVEISDDGQHSHRVTIHFDSKSIRNALEVMSTFLWVMMILWIEIGALIIYFYVFVS